MKKKINYKIIDNFLSEMSHQKILNTLQDSNFPWYLQKQINHNQQDSIYNYYFAHTFYNNNNQNSNLFYLWEELIKKLNIKRLVRLKANLYFCTKDIIEHSKHIDYSEKGTTSIYYVNTNNGYTNLDDKIKVKSIYNRFLKFDNNILHNSTTCSDKKYRITVVINYE